MSKRVCKKRIKIVKYLLSKILRAEGCICWEKEEDTVPCEKKSCPKVKGLKGKCGVEPPAAKGWVKSEYKCEEK